MARAGLTRESVRVIERRALTALRINQPTIAGVGLGGSVALRLAATRPERVERLVLVNAAAFDLLPGRERSRQDPLAAHASSSVVHRRRHKLPLMCYPGPCR